MQIYKAFVTSGWQRADLVASSARGGDKKKPRDRRGSLTVALKRGPWGDLMSDSTHLVLNFINTVTYFVPG